MTEKKLVNFRVPEDTKGDWEDWIDESNEIGSLSQFLRSAANDKIQGGNNSGGQPVQRPTIDDDRMSELVDGMNRLERTVEDMSDRLRAVEREVSATAERAMPEHDVLMALPPEKPHTAAWERARDKWQDMMVNPDPSMPDYEIAWSGRLEDIADAVDMDADQTEHNLRKNPSEMYDSAEIDGETRYFKTER